MQLLAFIPLLLAASPIQAAPLTERDTPVASEWDKGAVTSFQIHSSCNVTERRMLQRGLDDAVTLAKHAKDHVLRFGNTSPLFQKYFGNAATGEVIGNLERVASADRGRVLFRCDNPDGNCDIPTYGGHWRGKNATDETVICPRSYTTRLYLEYFCTRGYTVAGSSLNTYFGTDLLHRLYHMPGIGEGHIDHYSKDYSDIINNLAKKNSTFAVRDSDALQYFAADTYAFDIALPGVGCSGTPAS